MIKTVLKIDGMMCGMCESHVNDLIRRELGVKKVTSSHKSGESVIISEDVLNIESLRSALESLGYRLISHESSPYEKKGLFSFLKKQ